MYSVKGFVTIPSLVSNTAGVTSGIGELSDYSYSFSKEKGFYEHNGVLAEESVELTTFTCKDGDTSTTLSTKLHENIFVVADYIAQQILGFNLDSTTTSLTEPLYAAHSNEVENVDCGEMVQRVVDGDSFIAPEWVSWTVPVTGEYVRLWFVDESFRTQYDEYEIVVVPPFTPLDNFFLAGSQVETLLKAVTVSSMISKLQLAKNEFPETVIRVDEYEYHNPSKTSNFMTAKFGVLVYGEAGNNDDAIKIAISNYILSNSSHSREEWAEILPDIFKRTEFIFTPLWNRYAIPNRELEAGIYSPVAKINDLRYYARLAAPKYPPTHIEVNLTSFTHTYRSLAVACVGGPENRDGKAFLSDWWSDFIVVNTASTDFNRMEPTTQEFALDLDIMIQTAEKMTRYSRIPAGFSRLTRDGVLYIEKSINNVQYLVVAKVNYEEFDKVLPL